MRIIDRRRDYYDGVQRDGQDLTCLYVRGEKEIIIDPILPRWERGHPMRLCSALLIGFCGKIHAVLRHSDDYCYDPYLTYKPESFHFSADSFLQRFLEMDKKSKIEKNFQRAVEAFFNEETFADHKSVLGGFFREHKVPVFVISKDPYRYSDPKDKLVLNPMLKDFGFQRIADPYRAFQSIHQYMSGVLGGDAPPIPEIDDETRVAIHGFDKQSFRTPAGAKPNRKNGKK